MWTVGASGGAVDQPPDPQQTRQSPTETVSCLPVLQHKWISNTNSDSLLIYAAVCMEKARRKK